MPTVTSLARFECYHLTGRAVTIVMVSHSVVDTVTLHDATGQVKLFQATLKIIFFKHRV